MIKYLFITLLIFVSCSSAEPDTDNCEDYIDTTATDTIDFNNPPFVIMEI